MSDDDTDYAYCLRNVGEYLDKEERGAWARICRGAAARIAELEAEVVAWSSAAGGHARNVEILTERIAKLEALESEHVAAGASLAGRNRA